MSAVRPRVVPDGAESRCHAIIEHAADGILLTMLDGRVLAANPAACKLLGRTEEEICTEGRAGIAIVDEAARRFLEERERTGHGRGVLTLRRKDGTTFLAEVASTVFEGPDGERWTSMTFRDVTEAERGRRALAILSDAGHRLVSSLDLADTLTHLTDVVVPHLADVCTVDLLGPNGVERVAVAHRDPSRVSAFRHVRRRQVNEAATAGVDYVLRTGRASSVYELTEAWLERATLDRAHFEAARALGVRSFVSVPLTAGAVTRGALTLMSDGGVPAFTETDLPLVRALGERAAMAIENARRHADVVEARRLRDEVLSVVAHDLRGPLGVIQLTNDNLAKTGPSRETEVIARSLTRANTLIRDLLLATKAETGTIPLVLKRESVALVLDELQALHAPLADAKGIRFVVAIDGELPRAKMDRHRIAQMLGNLVTNAIKYTPEGGRVEVRGRSDDGNLIVTVSDTGVGISASDLPHVFDRYWQGVHARDVGAGLGLAISRGIARAHGGEITVSSQPGRGTTFTITLPRDGARPETSPVAPSPSGSGRATP